MEDLEASSAVQRISAKGALIKIGGRIGSQIGRPTVVTSVCRPFF